MTVNAFQITNKASKKDEASVVLCCNDLAEKRAWIKDIKHYIKEFQRQDAKRRKVSGLLCTLIRVRLYSSS